LTEVIQVKDINPKLESLIAKVDVVNANLKKRLRQISRWSKTQNLPLTEKR